MILKLFDYIYLRILGRVAYARRKGVKIGEGCRIYIDNFGSEPWLIEIGDRVTITSGVYLLTHDGATWLIRDENGRRYNYAKIRIGSDVFVGVGSIILPGVSVGNNVIVAAGSVVTKSIPDGTIVAGNPARIIGAFDEYKKKCLDCFFSEKDVVGKSFFDRVNLMVKQDFRNFMK